MGGNFGFIHEKIEIKILILFILRRLAEPVTFDVLTELTMCDDGIGYFDFTECVAELIRTGHLRFNDNKYSLTEKGERNGEATEYSLPFSVRVNAENETAEMRIRQSRNSLITSCHTVNSDGAYTVLLSLSDGVGEIISMKLFSANKKQALALEKGFRNNAESIYNALIEAILD